MKVLLIWPLSDTVESNRSRQTLMESRDKLGILYIASYLEQYSISVSVLDMDVDGIIWHEAKQVIKRSNADIIGISIMTHTRFTGFKTAKMAKKVLPKSLVVVGGPHVSPTARDTLTHIKEVDVVVIGEGEETMHELCAAVQNGRDLSQVDGIAYRQDGKYFETPPRKTIENLDILFFPARHLLKRYSDKNYPKSKMLWVNKDENFETTEVTSIITSRGCPHRCSFCTTRAMFGRKVRKRSPENIVAELEHIINNYSIKAFYIVDDTLTIDESQVMKICDLIIEKKLDIQWMCLTRVDCLSPELLVKMKEAGCVYITMGVESGSQRVLDEIVRKNITLEQAKKALLWCKEIGIGVRFNFMLSFPGETYKEMLETLNACIEFGHCGLNFTMIMPGTEIEKEAIRRSVLPQNFSWTRRKIYPKIDPFFTGIVYYYIEDISFVDIFPIFLEYTKMQKYYTTDSIINRHIRKIFQLKSFGEIYWLFAFYIGTAIVMIRRKASSKRQIV